MRVRRAFGVVKTRQVTLMLSHAQASARSSTLGLAPSSCPPSRPLKTLWTSMVCVAHQWLHQCPTPLAGFNNLTEMINKTGGQATWVPIISSYFLTNTSNPPKDIVLPSLFSTPFGQYVVADYW